ncbi:hypothetical protein P7B02_09020 [Caulobacter segnis]|uniref:hypothetical protein n=1 Tax=Caulobacter segnis TaxID=88688 RepID=UPI00240FCCBB|nr:hypothetical protein [Caulobacter segnis]MDG2521684.1 hypothetical protein [Caulobacter segnis]
MTDPLIRPARLFFRAALIMGLLAATGGIAGLAMLGGDLMSDMAGLAFAGIGALMVFSALNALYQLFWWGRADGEDY